MPYGYEYHATSDSHTHVWRVWVHTFIHAWASVLPSYLERQCEGLKVWDSNKSDSHAFIVYTPHQGIGGDIYY